ncbi:hypothetical protein HYFRA_00002615 [Hymenoscyphus fraxineus]|uniref:Uncharacterized protein n=1 Tax=Hymenoscyphus fraxineus TaxID=746836 RepID=A0A9N9PZI2_9HELO|nr:hypothetical protein HYFRA_00002615 [Hymenoscyphus fraxineus]
MLLESVKGASTTSTASKNFASSSENLTLLPPRSLGSVSKSVVPLRGNLISAIQTPKHLGKGQITTQNHPTSSLVTSTMKAASASFLTASVTPSNCRAPLVTEAPRSMITRATTKRTHVPSRGITIPPFRIALDFPHSSEEGFGGDDELDDDDNLDDDEDLDDEDLDDNMPLSKSKTAVPGGPVTPREPTSSPSALVPQTRKRVTSAAGLERRKNRKRRKASYATIC